MAKITQRLVKGSPLTYIEGDANFEILERISTFATVGVTYTAEINDFVIPDNSASAATVTLPASPEDGDFVVVKQALNQPVSTYSITVDRNGNNINGAAADFVSQDDDVILMFSYQTSGTTWVVHTIGQATASSSSVFAYSFFTGAQ